MTTLIVNPGGVPDLRELAELLSYKGVLLEYLAPAVPSLEVERRIHWRVARYLPALERLVAPRKVSGRLARRSQEVGLRDEILYEIARRSGKCHSLTERLRQSRNQRLATVARLRIGMKTIVAPPDVAAQAFKRTDPLLRVLHCTAAHPHHQMRDLGPYDKGFNTRDRPPERLVRQQVETALALSDVVVVASQHARESYVEAGVPASKLEVIPLGVQLAPLERPSEWQRTGTVLYVGQLSERKNILNLLRAFEYVRDATGLQLRLHLVGLLGLPHDLINRPWVEYTPHVPRSKLQEFYAAADFLVQPSPCEGFGLTLLEALAAGLPVLATPHSAAPDLGIDGVAGRILQAVDLSGLVEGLRQMVEDENLPHYRVAARVVARKYSLEAYGHNYQEMLLRRTARLETECV